PARPRSPRAPTVFPPDLVLEPVSRRPTTLPRETIEAAHGQPSRPHREPPRMGPGSASVVVVTYDGLPFTRLCLETVLAHGGEVDFELIVVDNGSSDGTPKYLTRLSREDRRVRVLLNGRNTGFAVACNQGMGLANG